MARINIEDEIHKDFRFFNLLEEAGKPDAQAQFKGIDLVYGALVRMWILAQRWYLSPSKKIPLPVWKQNLMPDVLIKTGWARIEGDFVYVCGSEDQFAWLDQRVAAGKKGGVARRGKKLSPEESAKRQGARMVVSKAVKSGELEKPDHCTDCGQRAEVQGHHSDYNKPLDVVWLCDSCHDYTHAKIEQSLKQSLATANQPLAEPNPPSLPLSPTLSLTQAPAQKKSTGRVKPAPNPELNRRIWEAYAFAYLERYGVEPTRNASVSSMIAQLGHRLGQDAVGVTRFYVAHNKAYYVQTQHTVGPLLKDAEALHTQWKRGQAVLGTQARELERVQHNADAFAQAAERIRARSEAQRG